MPAALVTVLGLTALATQAFAVPANVEIVKKASITSLTTAQIDALTPYAWYASAAYCEAAVLATWSCGANCNANSEFEVVTAGGDGTDDPDWYVGYDSTLDTVIVGHEGTNSSSLTSYLEDADFFLESLDPTLFPGVSSSVEAHNGFQKTHAASAPAVLAAVKQTLAKYPTSVITVTGHSLGAAIATLSTMYLQLNVPDASSYTFRTFNYGQPRIGNQDFADYVDAHFSLTHVNNKEDFVPILPGMFLGFVHPSGEVHIQDSGVWSACPGQDNPSTECIVGDVPEIWDGSLSDHDGPYNGVTMGC